MVINRIHHKSFLMNPRQNNQNFHTKARIGKIECTTLLENKIKTLEIVARKLLMIRQSFSSCKYSGFASKTGMEVGRNVYGMFKF